MRLFHRYGSRLPRAIVSPIDSREGWRDSRYLYRCNCVQSYEDRRNLLRGSCALLSTLDSGQQGKEKLCRAFGLVGLHPTALRRIPPGPGDLLRCIPRAVLHRHSLR